MSEDSDGVKAFTSLAFSIRDMTPTRTIVPVTWGVYSGQPVAILAKVAADEDGFCDAGDMIRVRIGTGRYDTVLWVPRGLVSEVK